MCVSPGLGSEAAGGRNGGVGGATPPIRALRLLEAKLGGRGGPTPPIRAYKPVPFGIVNITIPNGTGL